MDNLNDLKAIWHTADTNSLPNSGEMLHIVKKFRNQRLTKKVLIICMGLAAIAIAVIAGFILGPNTLSTRLGEAFTIMAAFILVFTNARSMKRFIRLKDCSNKEFIEFLEQTRRNQVYYHNKTQVAGMVLSSAGLLLYLYDLVYKDLFWFIFFYSVSIIWLLYLWLVMRPRNFKKQALKINETMKKLENISNQINN